MIIKFCVLDEKSVVSIPDHVQWELSMRSTNEKGYNDCGLYLTVNGKEYAVTDDADAWCSGRNLPGYAVGDLHNAVVDEIAERMATEPNLRMIDVDEIISELLSSTFKKEWQEKGYIELDANGNW